MPDELNCNECGKLIPADAGPALCPVCLLRLGLEAGEDEAEETEVGGTTGPMNHGTKRADAGEKLLGGGQRVKDGPRESEGNHALFGAASPSRAILRRVGDYELLEELARGAMGVVYRARQVSLNRVVAVKMILSGQLASEEEIKRFHTEAEAAANLDHPNIVPIYEVGQVDGQPYLSMRLVEGHSLAHLMKGGRARLAGAPSDDRAPLEAPKEQGAAILPWLDLPAAAKVMVTVSRAVHHAHQRRILHRDIKPANIMIDRLGEPHVTDFGLAKRVDVSSGGSESVRVMGTPDYMSPEQAQGRNHDLTTATDVWSLGATLYCLMTGRPPFQAGTGWETMKAVVEQEPLRPRLHNRRVDRDLETICLKCLKKNPDQRYASAHALAEDLQRWLRGEPLLRQPQTLWEHIGDYWDDLTKWVKRNPAIATLSAVLALVFILGCTIGIWLLLKYWDIERERVSRRVMEGLEAFLPDPHNKCYSISSVDRRIMSGEWPFKDKLGPPSRPHLVFAVYTHSEPINMLGRFRTVLDYLEPKLAAPIDFRIYKGYSNAVNDLAGGTVNFMWIGPVSYVQARERNPNLVLLAQQLHKGTNRMHGVAFTRVGSAITNLAALTNHVVAFGDPDSTFGSILARAELVKAGIYSNNVVGHRHFPSHPAVVQSVLSDTNIAAGFANFNAVAKAIADGKVTVIKSMQSVTFPWVGNTNRQPTTVLKIKHCLLELKDPTVLTNIDRDLTGFQPGRPEDYDELKPKIKDAERFER